MEKSVDIVEKLEFSTAKPAYWKNCTVDNVHNFLYIFCLNAAVAALRNREKYGNQTAKFHEKVGKSGKLHQSVGRCDLLALKKFVKNRQKPLGIIPASGEIMGLP